MKIGVKTYDSEKFLDAFPEADFFEVQAIQKNNYNFLKKYKKPFVIHAEHLTQGTNPADKTKIKQNLKSINFARKLADKVNAKIIIMHPGLIDNENSSEEQAIKFLKNIKDKRILLENLVPVQGRLCITPEETKNFLKQTNKNLILDLGHLIVSANREKLNFKKTLKEFLKLKPKHFHISGQNKNAIKDNHKSFKETDLNLKSILKLYPKNAWITLEVTTSIKKTKRDLEYIRKIINEL